MKKTNLFLCFILTSTLVLSCLNNEQNQDKEKIVEMTIYPETGYGSSVLCDTWTELLIFSESDDSRKRLLSGIIVEQFDFEYERGYKYTFKAKKIWMNNPPQDVSSIKYVYMGELSKTKVITVDSTEDLELTISPKTVKFSPRYPTEYENGLPKVYNALLAHETVSNDNIAIKEIEDFDFEEGYTYKISVKKEIKANPYAVRYVLLKINDKQVK